VTKNSSFEIIHAHYGTSALVASFAKRKYGRVVSFMGDDILGSNRKNGTITGKSLFLAYVNKLNARFFYNYSIVKSAEMYDKLNGLKKIIIPNGVNSDIFKPADKEKAAEKLKWDPQVKHVIFVSDPARAEKNYNLAKRSVDLINDKNIRLVSVSGIGQHDLVDFYNAADVLLLTSFHEGSPNVIKEAMACNCPVVSTNVGDVKILLENVDGCYVTDPDLQDVQKNILKAIDYRRQHRYTNGRDKLMKMKLDSDSVAEKIIDLYKTLVK
jgi:teichuronic acid biosynthesis glycosyltransferase TuaC